MQVAADILTRFPSLAAASACVALGNADGFSGARLFRCSTSRGDFALRAWPAAMTERRLAWLHGLLLRAASVLPFVPGLERTIDGNTWVVQDDRLWEATAWMPGSADLGEKPALQRIRNASRALGRLHPLWREQGSRRGPCPAVARRLQSLDAWRSLVERGWQPRFEPAGLDPVTEHAIRAWRLLPPFVSRLRPMLDPWRDRPFALQPCLCDIWRAHVLFTGDEVTGLVDFGSAKVDHVAVDIARMLGSFVGGDSDKWSVGLAAYREIVPFDTTEEDLAHALEETGAILAATNWLRWLYHEGRTYPDRRQVASRLKEVVGRIEGMSLVET